MKRTRFPLLILAAGTLLSLFSRCTNAGALRLNDEQKDTAWQCLPCGNSCDTKTYSEATECTSCHMPLVKRSSVVFKTIEPSAICDYIAKHPDVVLLDVRTKEEFAGKAEPDYGTLKGAINLPVQELENKLPSIADLKNKEVIVYCSHSHRSPQASYILTQNGFTNVTNMAGGMSVLKEVSCKK